MAKIASNMIVTLHRLDVKLLQNIDRAISTLASRLTRLLVRTIMLRRRVRALEIRRWRLKVQARGATFRTRKNKP